jgi:Cu(I)/Ag(I) efflux system membrane protein CusA/SilA
MVGGIVTSTLLELVVYPVIYLLWRGRAVSAGRRPHSENFPLR